MYNVGIEFSFRHMKLTAEQKCDIAQRELEELRDEIEKLKDESEKILDNFRVGQQIHVHVLLINCSLLYMEQFQFSVKSNQVITLVWVLLHSAV